MERGKYARLCIQIDLTKPLLAMFSIKYRHYKVEYACLHLLCLTCGKFGHYTEECMEKHQVLIEGVAQGRNKCVIKERESPPIVVPWMYVKNKETKEE